MGWRSFWWLNVALNAAALLVTLFCLPETKWDRPRDTKQLEQLQAITTVEKNHAGVSTTQSLQSSDVTLDSSTPSATELGLDINAQRSVLGAGRPSKQQWQLFQRTSHPVQALLLAFYLPWKLFTFPIVQFASFIVGFSSSCYLMITFVQSQVLAAPPYNFDTQSVGFTNFASLIGAFIGLLTAGPLSDWVSAKLTERNKGVREPEMRLPTMVPYVLIMLLGNFVVGFGFQHQWDWRVSRLLFQISSTYTGSDISQAIVIVGFGCAGLQIAALPAIASTYAVDSYKPAAGSIFISVTINKNVWGYGVSKFITPWVMQSGYVPPFMTNMSLTFLWCSCGIIFWLHGKKFRTWTAKSSVHDL